MLTRSLAEDWLPFLKTYRTICVAPSADFRRMLEDVREFGLAAQTPYKSV